MSSSVLKVTPLESVIDGVQRCNPIVTSRLESWGKLYPKLLVGVWILFLLVYSSLYTQSHAIFFTAFLKRLQELRGSRN